MLEYNRFKNCENEYRSAPFWSWNDKLDQDELLKQLHEMHEQGMGGFFMHARGGLTDEYLGVNFMEAVKACVKEAERLGMKAWLYDEDFASSGYAGGKIVKVKPELAAIALEIEKVGIGCINQEEDILAIFPYPQQHADVKLVFRIVRHDPAPHHDHQSYTDLCSKEAVDHYIAITHEKYKTVVGPYFNRTIPGIFTDEPHFSPEPKNTISLPWSKSFEKEFEKIKGYDILKCLDQLIVKKDGSEKVRFDYWDVISGMFTRAYVKNIYDWCEQNHLKFTGHFYEDIFPDPIRTGSVMPNYEHMHIPGIDMLFNTKEEREHFGNVFIVKEISSVANQLNKDRILSETYGASGWELNFEDQKKVADWQFALGVNFICQHLVHYSLRGFRKRDYPLSFYAHQPWWNCYRVLGDYIGRLSYVMSQGNFTGDILVLHSSSSTWAEYSPDGCNDLNEEIGCSMRTLTKNLSEIQYFFDLGDDKIMERHGAVEKGRVIIGQAAYKTVVIPSMTIMRSSSFLLLKRFVDQGGKIVCTGITPKYLDGQENSELIHFFGSNMIIHAENSRTSLKRALMPLENSHASMEELDGKEPSNIYCHYRKCDNKQILFLCNISKEENYHILLKLEEPCYAEEWDALNGSRNLLNTIMKEGHTCIELEFPPVASHLLILDRNTSGHPNNPASPSGEIIRTIQICQWQVNRLDYNAITLNRCRAALDGGPLEEEDNVLIMDEKFKDRLGLERASIFSRQPWAITEEIRSKVHKVKACYVFTIAENLQRELFLAAESPEIYEISVNGKLVEPSGKTYKDRTFILYDIREAVTPGNNEIVLNTNGYGVLTSLESIYIVGDFRLEKTTGGFALQNEQPVLTGDWTVQGYPYYSGSMKYSCTLDMEMNESGKVEFEFESFQGVAVKVLVNDREAGVIGWKPYKVDITNFITHGKNQIELHVMNSLQNLLGPHHYLPREGVVAPESFYCKEDIKFMPGGFNGKSIVKIYNNANKGAES